MKRCHALRKKNLNDFTPEDLRIMIGQDIGLSTLLPKAIALLHANPLAQGDMYAGDLLMQLLRRDHSILRGLGPDYETLHTVCQTVLAIRPCPLSQSDRTHVETFAAHK